MKKIKIFKILNKKNIEAKDRILNKLITIMFINKIISKIIICISHKNQDLNRGKFFFVKY